MREETSSCQDWQKCDCTKNLCFERSLPREYLSGLCCVQPIPIDLDEADINADRIQDLRSRDTCAAGDTAVKLECALLHTKSGSIPKIDFERSHLIALADACRTDLNSYQERYGKFGRMLLRNTYIYRLCILPTQGRAY